MPELSNLLRERLGAAESGAGVHPDADTLTAFNEKLLPANERQKIVGHLAKCVECREVLALSDPHVADSPMQPVIKPVAVPAWRRFFAPALGLGASVAAMAVIALVMLQSPHKQGPVSSPGNQEAKVIPSVPKPLADQERGAEVNQPLPDQPAAIQSSHVAEPAPSMSNVNANNVNADDRGRSESLKAASNVSELKANKDSATKKKIVPVAEPVLTASLPGRDFVNNNLFAVQTSNVVSVVEQDKKDFPAHSQTAAAAAAFPANGADKLTMFSDIPANVAAGKSDTGILTPIPPADHAGFITKWVQAGTRTLRKGTLSPSIRAGTLGSSALGGPGMFAFDLQRRQPAEVSATPEKAEAGGLEKSGALSRRALSSSTLRFQESGAVQWKVAGGKLLKSNDQLQWVDAYPAASGGLEFFSVAWHGSDVWAGGGRALLVHSRDGGLTWEDIKIGDATGSIVSIVAGSLNVQVRTADNQVWSSADAGKTWVQQPTGTDR